MITLNGQCYEFVPVSFSENMKTGRKSRQQTKLRLSVFPAFVLPTLAYWYQDGLKEEAGEVIQSQARVEPANAYSTAVDSATV